MKLEHKNLGKTKFLQDARKGMSMCLQIQERQSIVPFFKEVTKVTSKAVFFGKRKLDLPDAKHFFYSGMEVHFLNDMGEPEKKYSVSLRTR